MKKLYSIALLFCFLLVNAQAYTRGYNFLVNKLGVIDTAKKQSVKASSKFTDTRKDKPSYLQSGVNVNIVPFKPSTVKQLEASTSTATSPASSQQKQTQADLKILSNVKVYPNPVAEQLNLTYFVNKDSNVTIKIMDVLGNEIATLLSQRMSAGEQTNSFSIASKLNSGYYFIRLIVGNETVVKRVSIL